MRRKDILYTAIITTLLALNPLFISPLSANTQVQTSALSYHIVTNLYKRGIELDAAKELGELFVDNADMDENMLFYGLKNLANGCDVVSEEEIINHISMMALKRQKVDVTNYSSLVAMVQKMKHSVLDNETLKQLEQVALKNEFLVRSLKAAA